MIVDDIVVPIEVGLIKLSRKTRLMDRVTKDALKTYGQEPWAEAVVEAVEILQNIVKPDETILGAATHSSLILCPQTAAASTTGLRYVGAQRLWEGSDLFASACPTSWRIHRNEAHA